MQTADKPVSEKSASDRVGSDKDSIRKWKTAENRQKGEKRVAKPKKDLKTSGINELRDDIKNKSFRRVYLLYGAEDYLVTQYRRALIDAVCGDNATMNLNIHRDEKLDWGQLQDEILSMPFFAEHRMVVLDDTKLFMMKKKASAKDDGENPESPQTDTDAHSEEDTAALESEEEDAGKLSAAIAAFIPNIPETCVVVFTELPDEIKANGEKGKTHVDKRNKLYKAIAKYGLAVDFSAPDDKMLRSWIISKLGKEKIQIRPDTLDLFIRMVGNNMSHISTETEKLVSYAGRGGTIRTEDVEALTSELLEGKIFRMLDLLSQHDRTGALELYDDLIRIKEPPVKILIMLVKQIDKLLLVRSILDDGGSADRVMTVLGQSSWQAGNLIRQARRFSTSQLREAVEEGVRMQEKAQTGQIDMRLGLELLILRFTA